MATDPRNLGPDGKDVDVSGEHLDQAAACLSTATARRDEAAVAQAIANAEARGFHAIDRPRGRAIDHNTTAHRIARDLAGPIREDGPTEEQREQLEAYLRDALADAYTAGRADQLTEQTPAGVALTAEQWTEVRRLFFSMPYAGSPRGRMTGEGGPADAVDLVEWLRGLQRVLVVVGRQQSEAHTELDKLRAQREAFREYAGAGLLGLLALAKADAPNPLELAHRAEGPEPEGLELLGTAEESARWQLDPAEQVKHHATALAAYLHPDDDERARQYIAAAVRVFERTQEPDPLV